MCGTVLGVVNICECVGIVVGSEHIRGGVRLDFPLWLGCTGQDQCTQVVMAALKRLWLMLPERLKKMWQRIDIWAIALNEEEEFSRWRKGRGGHSGKKKWWIENEIRNIYAICCIVEGFCCRAVQNAVLPAVLKWLAFSLWGHCSLGSGVWPYTFQTLDMLGALRVTWTLFLGTDTQIFFSPSLFVCLSIY